MALDPTFNRRRDMKIERIRGAVARGWCHPDNSSKTLDVDLAEAISQEVKKALDDKPDADHHDAASRTSTGDATC